MNKCTCDQCKQPDLLCREVSYHVKDRRDKWRLTDENICKWCFIGLFAHDRPSPPGFFRGARVHRS